jgi:hypothetical protein
VNRYKYLGIHFCASGFFYFAQEELYKKALKACFKFSKDQLSLNPTIKTSMHVFDHIIKPILLYGCEVWGILNPFTSKFRNTLLNFSRIFDKLPAEKLHQKFCKYILGVPSRTSNTAVLSELGRFPIYFNIVKALVKYYYRLKNIQSDFPVLHDASEESKILSHSNKPLWYASINYIFKIIKTYKSGNDDNMHAGGKLVQNYFLHRGNRIYRHKLMVNYALMFFSKVILGVKNICL